MYFVCSSFCSFFTQTYFQQSPLWCESQQESRSLLWTCLGELELVVIMTIFDLLFWSLDDGLSKAQLTQSNSCYSICRASNLKKIFLCGTICFDILAETKSSSSTWRTCLSMVHILVLNKNIFNSPPFIFQNICSSEKDFIFLSQLDF